MFLSKNKAIGINISDQNIKIAKLVKTDNNSVSSSFKKIAIPKGIIEKGRIKDEEHLLEYLKEALSGASIKNRSVYDFYVVFPEASLYTYFFKISVTDEKLLIQKIEEEVLSSIPLNREELVYSYKILEKNLNKKSQKIEYRIFIVAASIEIIDSWKNIFDKLGVKLIDFSVEAVTTFYGLFKKYPEEPVCIVDMGANITNIIIGFKNNLFYSYSYFCGGNACNDKIVCGIKSGEKELTFEEAENMKREIGISANDKSNNISTIIKSAMLPIIEEIITALNYFKEEKRQDISKIYLIGGSSKVKGMKEYISSNLPLMDTVKTELKEGSDQNISRKAQVLSGESIMDAGIPVEFISSYGAALQAFNKEKRKDSILLPTVFSLLSQEKDKDDNIENEEIDDDEAVGRFSWIKNHRREFQLILVVVFGVTLMSLAFWMRAQDAKKKLLENPYGDEVLFGARKVIEMKTLVTLDNKAYTSEKIRARIFKTEIKNPMNYEEVLELSKSDIEKQISAGETYWKNHLNEVNKESLIFPLTLEWLVYPEKDINQVFLFNLKNQQQEEFLLNSITLTDVVKEGDNYYMIANVDISVNGVAESSPVEEIGSKEKVNAEIEAVKTESPDKIDKTETVSTQTNAPKSLQELSALLSKDEEGKNVKIKETGLGYLNIRKEPNTNSEVVLRAKTGEDYKILEEKDDWIKISISEDQQGWAFAEYLEKW